MKLKIAVMTLLITVLLAACGQENTDEGNVAIETEDIKELVHDYSVGNIKDQSASITSSQLIVTDSDKNEFTYDLPEDDFFVSIAPYVNETHPCTNHSLTGCQGEMVEEEFDVYIQDNEGNVVLDEKLNSQANGFFDLWLPRDQTYTIVIAHNGKKVESTFSTFVDDGTCITTMQLL